MDSGVQRGVESAPVKKQTPWGHGQLSHEAIDSADASSVGCSAGAKILGISP